MVRRPATGESTKSKDTYIDQVRVFRKRVTGFSSCKDKLGRTFTFSVPFSVDRHQRHGFRPTRPWTTFG